MFRLVLLSFVTLFALEAAFAADELNSVSNNSPASEALRTLHAARGLKIELFASDPDIQNPVSFCFDEQGRVLLVESHRRRTSVIDIRGHLDWLERDFSFRTPEDRGAFFRSLFPERDRDARPPTGLTASGVSDMNHDGVVDWHDLEAESERIRLLEDTNGDGRADRVTTFADGFNTIVSGVAAGILARHGEVYFTCIPDLWRLRASNGVAAARTRLLSGFGNHIALGGHDMHGLIFGPDGKLYWSIADRGTSTNFFAQLRPKFPGLTPELLADSGAVFRCDPDGSHFELFAIGLRNPQELAFDEFGNLFTGDNNGDGGDPARWTYVVEGGDYGWRIGWQWLPKMGAWNSEHLWATAQTNRAAYLVPSLAHIGHGPAGLCYNPGTGLPERFASHFFMCDFPGSVLMWTNRPAGAGFEVGPVENFFGECGPTDVAFSPGRGVFVSDWTKTFEKANKGRIYKVHDPETDASSAVLEVRQLLSTGLAKRSDSELVSFLADPDMRVRYEAQFWLVERARTNSATRNALADVALRNSARLARVHALWSLSQLAVSSKQQFPALASLASDPDAELRAQYAKLLRNQPNPTPTLISLLHDAEPRVRFCAAESLGAIGSRGALPALLDLLRKEGDPFIRHAAVFALARIGDVSALMAARFDPSARLRMAVLLALRRLERPEVVDFLGDADERIALEAARAINDVSIPTVFPELAAELKVPAAAISPERTFLLRRALNANFRLGAIQNAERLAAFVSKTNVPAALRVEALEMLRDWAKPPLRDKIVGLHRPLPARDTNVAARALAPVLTNLLADASTAEFALAAAIHLGIDQLKLFPLVGNPAQPTGLRVAALREMAVRNDPRLQEALELARNAAPEPLRTEAYRIFGKGMSVPALEQMLRGGSIAEKQSALAVLATMPGSEADAAIASELEQLTAGSLPRGIQLDVLEAAAQRNSREIKAKLGAYQKALSKEPPLVQSRFALAGGNPDLGRRLFFERQDIGCFRCHKINGEGGDVGPDLTGIGSRQPREYILESIVTPNARIAPGFESISVTLKNGTSYAGVLKSETATDLVLNSPEDGLLRVKKSDLAARQPSLSAMPEDLAKLLTKRELRDLVEFLATSK